MTWRALVAACSVVVSVGALGGCADDPVPKVAEEPTPAPSTETVAPTSAPPAPAPSGPVEPPLPRAAERDGPGGAKAFVRYWVDLVNYGQQSGDVETLESVMDSRCAGCRGVLRALRDPYAAGGRIEGGTWQLTRLRELPPDHGADWGGFAEISAAPQVVHDGTGAATSYPGGDYYVYAYTSWNDEWGMKWLRAVTPKS